MARRLAAAALCAVTASGLTPNVLLIMVDDLRPELEPYGAADMRTPHINRLSARGVTFLNHYVQQSLCSPSRTSFLTGRYPEQTRVFDLRHYWRDLPETNWTTLPQAFKERGYQTHGGGKTFHSGPAGGDNDALWSWNTPYFEPPSDNVAPWSLRTPDSWYAVDMPESVFPDMQTAVDGMAAMGAAARAGRPSFTAVGIRKPHLPFIFPLMYLGNLPNDTNTGKPWQRISNSSYWPSGTNTVAGNSWNEVSKYPDVDLVVNGSLPWDAAAVFPAYKQIELRRAYMAAVQVRPPPRRVRARARACCVTPAVPKPHPHAPLPPSPIPHPPAAHRLVRGRAARLAGRNRPERQHVHRSLG